MKKHTPHNPGKLRKQAEEQVRNMEPVSRPSQTHVESQRMLHELQVHQIELEMQNEELRRQAEERLHDITARKQTEKALQESEERFRDLFEKAPLGYQSLDIDGRFIEVNRTWLEILGYNREEVIGKWFGDFLAPEYVQAFMERFPVFKAEGQIHSEFYMRHKDGSRRYIAFDGRIGHNADGSFKQTHCILKDETERKQAEESLQLTRFSVEAASDALFWITQDSRIVDVNAAACRSLGYTREELLQLRVPDIDPHYNAEDSQERFAKLRQLGSITFESEHRAKDGRLFPVEIVDNYIKHGSVERSCAFVRDITERKKSADEVADLREALDAVAGFGFAKDLDLKYVSANRSFCDLLKIPYNKIQGMTDYDIFPADLADKYIADDRRVIETAESITVEEVTINSQTNQRFTVQTRKFPRFDKNGRVTGLYGMGYDITNLKQAEERRQEGFDLLKNLARLVPGVIYQYRLHPDGRSAFPYASPGMYDIYEVTPEEVREDASAVFGRIHPDDHERVAEAIFESARTLKTFECELRVILPKQGLRWRWSQAHPERTEDGGTLWHGIILDITERKGVEDAIRESAKLLSQAQEISHAGSWKLDLTTNLLIWSDEVYRIFGCKPQEFAPTYEVFLDFIHPDDRAAVDEAYALSLVEGNDGYEIDHRIVRRNSGEVRHVHERCVHTRDAAGTIIQSTGMVQDITDQNRVEEALKKTNKELQQAMQDLRQAQKQIIQQERLSALGQMASGIAHDFNNILMPIIGCSELLISNPAALDDREDAIHMLEMIRTAGEDARQIVRRLRTVYKVNYGSEYDMQDLARIAESALSITMAKWKEEMRAKGALIEIVTDFQPVPQIYGNASELREILTNLIFNSVDAMPNGGIITFRLHAEDDIAVLLEMTDTGEGMDEATLEQCIEPFFSTKGPQGSGLGLAVVHGIVVRHSGTLNIESRPGAGTTVKMRFPVPVQANATKLVSEKDIAPLPPMKVLVVDDEERATKLLTMVLERDNHQVETADNGRKGLDMLRKGKFDMIITDRAMPVMGGDEFAAQAQKIQPGIPVIMLTGFGEIMKDSGDLPPGVSRVMSKPLTMKDLRSVISSVMSKDSR